MNEPDEEMMAPIRRLARFMATLDDSNLEGVFAEDLTIEENFAPLLFRGHGAAQAWRAGFVEHARTLSDLVPKFETAQDFNRKGQIVYFVLPTVWSGKSRGRPFAERGGWSFILTQENGTWRIAAYAWSVIEFGRQDGVPAAAV
jgi:hypothetical protein